MDRVVGESRREIGGEVTTERVMRPLKAPAAAAATGTTTAAAAATAIINGKREVLVCTHGSRDCRCEQTGGALVLALRTELARRGLEDEVAVNEIAHVGGHKCVFPFSRSASFADAAVG